jgi:hypothetical protein
MIANNQALDDVALLPIGVVIANSVKRARIVIIPSENGDFLSSLVETFCGVHLLLRWHRVLTATLMM